MCVARAQGVAILQGVIACPGLGRIAMAASGGGAVHDGAAARARAERSVALVQLGYSPRIDLSEQLGHVERVIARGADSRRSGAGCIGLLNVATGGSNIDYEKQYNLWDVAPGLLFLADMGGICLYERLDAFVARGSEVLALNFAVWPQVEVWKAAFDPALAALTGEAGRPEKEAPGGGSALLAPLRVLQIAPHRAVPIASTLRKLPAGTRSASCPFLRERHATGGSGS